MMIAILSFTIVGSLLLHYAAKFVWRSYILWNAKDPDSPYRNLSVPPGDFGLPIIGETHLWAVQGSQFNSIRRRKYGKVFSTNFIGRTMVKVTGPEYVKQILTASHDVVATIWPTTIQRVLGKTAIANSVGHLHKLRRNAFLKAFTKESLNKYIPYIEESVREKMQSWCRNKDGTQFIHPETKILTFNIAFRVFVGLSFKNHTEQMRLFKIFDTMITNLLSLPYDIPGSGFRKCLKAKELIHEILDDHVRKLRKQVEENHKSGSLERNKECLNVLEIILEGQTGREASQSIGTYAKTHSQEGESSKQCTDGETLQMTDTELKETTVEMLFAGYQTTSSICTSAIINIINSPEVFHKLEQEMRHFGLLRKHDHDFDNGLPENKTTLIDTFDCPLPEPAIRSRKREIDTLNNNASKFCHKQNLDAKNPMTVDLLSKMTYLEQFFKETLRIMPPILGGYRVALQTFEIGGFRVPKGWTIIYNIRDTHESEWEEDVKFNPDRFSSDNWKDTKESRYRWIPFGGGSRTCIGKEFARLQFKIFIIELIRHFSKLDFAKGKPPKMFAVPFLHPTDGLPVKLTRRTQEKKLLLIPSI